MAFLAGAVGTASILWEAYKRTNRVVLDFTVKEETDLLVHLFDFVFGVGLFQAYQLFQQTRGVDRMSPPNLLKLTQTLSRLWLGVTALMSIDGLVFASDLKVPRLLGLTTFLFVTNVPFGEWFHRDSLAKENPSDVATDYATARKSGLGASRNMVWCVGSIAISGLIDAVECIVNTIQAEGTEEKVGNFISGLLDVSESVAIGGLLASLYKTLLRTVLTSTQRRFNAGDPSFREYFQAQTKFYRRLASFFGYQALFTVLGYVAEAGEMLWFKSIG